MKHLGIGATAALMMAFSVGGRARRRRNDCRLHQEPDQSYFQAVRVGAEAAGKVLKVRINQYVPTKPDSIPEQLSQVEDVIVKKPDAVVFIRSTTSAGAGGRQD